MDRPTPRFRNPVIPGFNPDPSICRVGEDYFLVTSSFEYFPGVPLYHSRDLVNWRHVGHCLDRPSQLQLEGAPSSGGIYAPTIRHHQGTFFMTTTNVSRGGHLIVRTKDPFGPWSEPVWVDQNGIDPSLFFEDDKVYFTSNVEPDPAGPHAENPTTFTRGIQQSLIDLATGRRLTDPRHIWSGTGGRYPEAPHLYRVDGRYYLLVAEGGTEYGHMITVARSNSPWGPFEAAPHNPILSHRSRSSPIQATGHGDLVQAHDGSWWMVFLAIRPTGHWPYHHLGRETFLAPVHWTEDGWPVVGEDGRVDLEMESGLPPQPIAPDAPRDEFDDLQLRPCWNFLRNPDPASWSLTERAGYLRLRGSAVSLDDPAGSPAFVGRRQQHFACTVRALLEFEPTDDDEAGLTVRMNERHHYEIAVTRLGGRRVVVVRRRIGSLAAVVAQAEAPEGPVELRIDAERERYAFSFGANGAAGAELAGGETRYLSSETAGGFTGVYIAMYATGNGGRRGQPADWDWFEYLPRDQG